MYNVYGCLPPLNSLTQPFTHLISSYVRVVSSFFSFVLNLSEFIFCVPWIYSEFSHHFCLCVCIRVYRALCVRVSVHVNFPFIPNLLAFSVPRATCTISTNTSSRTESEFSHSHSIPPHWTPVESSLCVLFMSHHHLSSPTDALDSRLDSQF